MGFKAESLGFDSDPPPPTPAPFPALHFRFLTCEAEAGPLHPRIVARTQGHNGCNVESRPGSGGGKKYTWRLLFITS